MNASEKNYDDIIDYDWNETSLSERMPLSQRAKIFLPFAALTGYEEALEETLKNFVRFAAMDNRSDVPNGAHCSFFSDSL